MRPQDQVKLKTAEVHHNHVAVDKQLKSLAFNSSEVVVGVATLPPSTTITNVLFGGEKTSSEPTTKRNLAEVAHSPNGLLHHAGDSKKRRLSQNLTITPANSGTYDDHKEQQSKNRLGEVPEIHFTTLTGSIGSTNIGTIPQHSKNLKGVSASSLGNGGCLKAGKATITKVLTKPVVEMRGSTTITATTPTQLPHSANISEEKFKQKFLENAAAAAHSDPTNHLPHHNSVAQLKNEVKVDAVQAANRHTGKFFPKSSFTHLKSHILFF